MKINYNENEIKRFKEEAMENINMIIDKLYNDYRALNLQNINVAKKLDVHQNYVSKLFRKREINLIYTYSFLLRIGGYKLSLKDLKVDHFSTKIDEIKNSSIKAYNNIMKFIRNSIGNTLFLELQLKLKFSKLITLEDITEVDRASSRFILLLQLSYYIGEELVIENISENKVEKFIDNVEKNNNYIKSYKSANNGTRIVEKVFNNHEGVKNNNDVPKRNSILTRKIGDEISLGELLNYRISPEAEPKSRVGINNEPTQFNSNMIDYNQSRKSTISRFSPYNQENSKYYKKQEDIYSINDKIDKVEERKFDNDAFLKSIINYQEELDKRTKTENDEIKENERKEILHYYVKESKEKKNMIFRKIKSDEEKSPYNKKLVRDKVIPAFTEYMIKLNMRVNEMIENEVDQEVILNIIKNNKMIYDDNVSFNVEDFINKESSRKDLIKIKQNVHQQEDDIINEYLSIIPEEQQEEVLEKYKLIKQVRNMEETCLTWLYSKVTKKK